MKDKSPWIAGAGAVMLLFSVWNMVSGEMRRDIAGLKEDLARMEELHKQDNLAHAEEFRELENAFHAFQMANAVILANMRSDVDHLQEHE